MIVGHKSAAPRRLRLLALIRRNAALGLRQPTVREHAKNEGVALCNSYGDFRSLSRGGEIARPFHGSHRVEVAHPASVRYFQIERRDGEAVLVPLRSGSEYTQGDAP